MIKHIASRAFLSLGLGLALVGCVKNDDFFNKETGNETAQTSVKFIGGGEEIIQRARNVDPTIDTFVLFEVRRDPRSEADVNQPLTVTLRNDTAVIGRYNRAHGTTFQQLPSTLYTFLDEARTVTFAPGEIAKVIRIRLDKTNLDLSKQYALGFSVENAGQGAAASQSEGQILLAVGVKNKYDGLYTVTGTMTDNANPALTGSYPWEVELRTSGPNSVIVHDHEDGGIYHLILNGGAPSIYGSFGMQFTFDPVTNKVISVVNPYGQPASNGRSAQLDPSGVNQWNPTTRDLTIRYWMMQPSVVANGPRTVFDEVFSYEGPR